MAHIALYRKYRPKTFSEVIGQKVVVESLKNQVSSGKIGHAFLFTGTRGTGKTSCAKIFAKAINCQHNHNGEPCLECDVCKGIENESVYDVTEMDAASNNSVEDIRDILSEVMYLPVMAKYKVYIIDEVHMLSTAAFNALLKTLEEPPAHVVFILATTELHKVPATILSRCQRYDFNKLSIEEIGEALMYIADCEDIQLSLSAAKTIASLADGAMRDATSILDTCLSRGNVITDDTVADVVGISKQEEILHLADCIITKDLAGALQQILLLEQKSVDIKRLCEELITHFRNLLLANLPKSTYQLLNVSEEKFAAIKKQAETTNFAFIQTALTHFTNAFDSISKGQNPKISLDIAIYNLCNTQIMPVAVQPAVQTAPVQSVQATSAVQQVAQQEEEKPVPFAQWFDTIDIVGTIDGEKPLYSLLKGSHAYLYKNVVYIEGHEALNDYLRGNKNAAAVVKGAIEKACGKKHNIGGYKNIADKFAPKKTDELAEILSLRNSGVEVTIKD
ncbi:MAG: DNA polymerase III subunit gamma/tau [Oscillospiraceae bacterium]|nr:DNA polymerase III subunit gamma/tau [Oscillospiraceae bacterium]